MGALLVERLAPPVGCKLSDPRGVGISRRLRVCLRGEHQNRIECIAILSYPESHKHSWTFYFSYS